MSVRSKDWKLKNSDPNKSTIEKILENRGLSSLEEELSFHDPFAFKDMEKAIERIQEAIDKKERIIIFGDYDVDGITSTAILFQTLKKLNATVSYRLPHRVNDGYGLSMKFIDEFVEKNIGLVITVDCGISCAAEVAAAKENGVDVIVTDHHRIPEKSPEAAVAIIHPKMHDSQYPYEELTGAGVALKLAQALIDKFIDSDDKEEFLESLFDLASMGTVADLGPITGENKYIVKKGLEVMANTRWPGLSKLREQSGAHDREPSTVQIGFQLAPRINSAGRIGDPRLAFSLLVQEEGSEKLDQLSVALEKLNKERQEMTQLATDEAAAKIEQLSKVPDIIVESSPDWHVGILGLIASKLVEQYNRPAIILQDRGDFLTASTRSPHFFNVVEALSEFSDLLTTYGGHPQAAGFSLSKENFPALVGKMQDYASKKIANTDTKAVLEIDCEIPSDDLTLEFLDEMEKLSPFGVANQRPRFLLKDFKPHFPKTVGKNSDHLKFAVEINRNLQNVIAFRLGEYIEDLRSAHSIDLVVELERNIWNGSEKLSLQALDFKINA